MKKQIPLIFGTFFLFLFWNFHILASEPVDLEAAKRAAGYHGESIFEEDLKVCAHELMYWPWGEQAVYVFTLMKEDDFYPSDIQSEIEFCQGAYLVSQGKRVEGFTMMAQAERYMTVVVGATKDMSPFIKAHRGLPEHVLVLATMENPPNDPHWVYAGLFHTFIGSEAQIRMGERKATEIHLKETVDLEELGREKVDTLPDYAEEQEWGPFIYPDEIKTSEVDPNIKNIPGIKTIEKKVLSVKEVNIRGTWQGCHPATFINCMNYKEKITKKYEIGDLLFWAAICFRTTPYKNGAGGATGGKWIIDGPKIMSKGLGYEFSCQKTRRKGKKPIDFYKKLKLEIDSDYPCCLHSGPGVFREHSTTGIGYWKYKEGNQIRLIIHDNWDTTPNEPVTVLYYGYPKADLQYPKYMVIFHPFFKEKFPKAKPKIEAPIIPPQEEASKNEVQLDISKNQWSWKVKVESKNEVKVECYAARYSFYDTKGKLYKVIPGERKLPYFKNKKITFKRNLYSRGKVKCAYYLVDENGHVFENKMHLFEKKKTIRIEDIIGRWRCNFTWKHGDQEKPGTCIDNIYIDGTTETDDGAKGTWELKSDRQIIFRYPGGLEAVYTGTVTKDYEKMGGTSKTTKPDSNGWYWSGTWSSKRLPPESSTRKMKSQALKQKSSGPRKDNPIRR